MNVIFDMDGVLFDTERVYAEIYEEVAAEWGLGSVQEAVLGCIGRNANDSRLLFLKYMGKEFPYDNYIQEVIRRFKERVEKEGLPMKAGVMDLLFYLKKEKSRIGLASSTRRERVISYLERAGIADYFQIVVGGDAVEHSKPNPEIYQIACKELGTVPEETYAIEDSFNGIRAAYDAGMKVIMVPDMLQPEKEIEGMLCRLCYDLCEVKYYLAGRKIQKIPLENLPNTRDLGGIITEDGRTICPHKLLRSGALFWSSEEDRTVLVQKYNLRTVVDFRTESEKKEKPDPEMPGVVNIWNPILEEAAMGITREEKQKEKSVVQQVLERTGGKAKGPEEYMQKMYHDLVSSEFSRKQYRKFFAILLAQENGAVLWHCSAGKDRVGIATALLLSALGVSRECIMADYIKTNDFVKEDVQQLLGKVKPEFRAAVRMLFVVVPSFLESFFQTIDSEFGGMDSFLEKEMGLTADKREKLRDMYLL